MRWRRLTIATAAAVCVASTVFASAPLDTSAASTGAGQNIHLTHAPLTLGMGQAAGAVVLKACGNETTFWKLVQIPGSQFFIKNNYRSAEKGMSEVLSAPGDGSENPLTLGPEGQSGAWQDWEFFNV